MYLFLSAFFLLIIFYQPFQEFSSNGFLMLCSWLRFLYQIITGSGKYGVVIVIVVVGYGYIWWKVILLFFLVIWFNKAHFAHIATSRRSCIVSLQVVFLKIHFLFPNIFTIKFHRNLYNIIISFCEDSPLWQVFNIILFQVYKCYLLNVLPDN